MSDTFMFTLFTTKTERSLYTKEYLVCNSNLCYIYILPFSGLKFNIIQFFKVTIVSEGKSTFWLFPCFFFEFTNLEI